MHPHPGHITYVDGLDGSEKSVPLAEVPESLRFADTREGPVPVVRVVAETLGDRRSIKEYGPAGQLLRTTLQLRGSA